MRQIINNWATQNKIIPQDWTDLMTAIYEAGPQLQWLMWWREESVTREQCNHAIGIQQGNHLLDEHQFAGWHRQVQLDATIAQWHLVV